MERVIYIVSAHETIPDGVSIIDQAFTRLEDAEKYLADANKKWDGLFLHSIQMTILCDSYDKDKILEQQK